MAIRAITFDVGGTLIEPWPSVGHVYAEVAARFGVPGLSPNWLTQNFVRAWKAKSSFDYARESWFALVRETFAEQSPQLPEEFYPSVYERFAEAEAWRIYGDVLPTIEALSSQGIRIGIISNWDERLRLLMENLGLMKHFSGVIVSCEVGVTKPDATLFARAAEELEVRLGELLHVGDSHEMDVLGATSAGTRARQVVRGKVPTGPSQIGSLAELVRLIENRTGD